MEVFFCKTRVVGLCENSTHCRITSGIVGIYEVTINFFGVVPILDLPFCLVEIFPRKAAWELPNLGDTGPFTLDFSHYNNGYVIRLWTCEV